MAQIITAKKEEREYKSRKTRIAKRKVLFRKNDPTAWQKPANGDVKPKEQLKL